LKRDDQKEREQDLHTSDDDAQLPGELLQVAIQTFKLCLVASLAIRAPRVLHNPLKGSHIHYTEAYAGLAAALVTRGSPSSLASLYRSG
jgi:hypothetical protein